MKSRVIVPRTVHSTRGGHRYRAGTIGPIPLRVMFDLPVESDPANIPHPLLEHLAHEAERDGRAIDVFLPWSDTFSHRLIVVTATDCINSPPR